MKRDTERGTYEMLTDRMRVIAERWWMAGDLGRTLRQAADAMENQQIRVHVQHDTIEKQGVRIEQLCAELRTAQAERDAALKDLAAAVPCEACIHYSETPADCDIECPTCKRDCFCRGCREGNKFEWRGVPNEAPEQPEEHGWKGKLLQTFMKGAEE